MIFSGLLGAPGSGVEWVRYLVEQMTGIYTGSVHEDFPEYFEGEGKTHSVSTNYEYDVIYTLQKHSLRSADILKILLLDFNSEYISGDH